MRKLLEAIYKFSGEPEQKSGEQVRGTDKVKTVKRGKGPYTKHPMQGKLVGGDSRNYQDRTMIETIEEKLKEMYKTFQDVGERRPAREGSRHPRGHEPQERYTVIQDDDSEAQKRVQTKMKNIDRQKKGISDAEWQAHQERMKKEREEYIKKHPDSMFKEEDVLSIKEDPFGQWVLVDKHTHHVKQAFDYKDDAYKYWEHFKLSPKDYKIMHGSEYVDHEEELAEYGTTGTIGTTGTKNTTSEPTEKEKAEIATATTTLKTATGTPVPPATLAKAIDSASQGKAVSATDARVLEPVMDVVKKAAEDPKIAQQFKNLAQQAKR